MQKKKTKTTQELRKRVFQSKDQNIRMNPLPICSVANISFNINDHNNNGNENNNNNNNCNKIMPNSNDSINETNSPSKCQILNCDRKATYSTNNCANIITTKKFFCKKFVYFTKGLNVAMVRHLVFVNSALGYILVTVKIVMRSEKTSENVTATK